MKYTIHRRKGLGIKSRVQILSALVLSLFVLTTFSCSNVFETPPDETSTADNQSDTKKDPELKKQKKGGITITLVQPENVQQSAGSRTLLPDIDLTNLTSISLTGTKSGESTVHTLGSWSSTSQLSGLIALEAGVWNLVLTASNSSFVFSDTKNVTIAIGQSQNVSFVLSASSTGGGINFKINFSDNAQKLEYNLYRYESGSFTSIENNPDATINTEPSGRSFTYVRNSSNPIQAGTYKLLLKFYGDSAGTILINTYSEIINVKAGFISRSTEKTINLNQMYSISYKTEAGNNLDPSEYTIKDSLGNITTLPYNYSLYSGEVSLPLLEKAGYIFDGWFTADELENLSSFPVTAISASESGNKEYRAKFVIEMKEGAAFHTAINNWNGAERMMPSTTPPDPSITISNYLDTGTNVPVWYDTTDSCIKYYAAGYTDGTSKLYLRPDSSGMFNGSWKFKVLDLTPFDTSRVTDMSNMFKGCYGLETVYVSSAFTTGAVNTSTDMFANCSIKLKGENGFTWDSTNDKTATYAKINTPTQQGYFWNAPSSPVYFITYVLNEGDNALTNPGSYTSEILPITLEDPSGQNSTGDSFQFEGWYTSSTFAAGTQVSTISDTSYGSFTLYAKWKVPYRVKHMQQNVTGSDYTEAVSDLQVLYGYAGDSTAASANPYTGFNTPTDAQVAQVAIEADGSTVVNIYYDRQTYTVTYDDGVAAEIISVPSAQTGIRYDATFTPTYTGVTRDGYDFGGWSDGTWVYTSSGPHTTLTMPNNDVTLMAQWNIIPYTLTLNKNDNNDTSYPATWTGTEPTGFTISQLPYTLPTASSTNRLTRNGYNFTGWYTAATGGAQITEITTLGAKTYYAHWDPVTYTLDLQENDNAAFTASWTGTEPNGFNVTQLPYTLPTASSSPKLTRTGYTFAGWYTAATGGSQVSTISTLGDKTYYAHWDPVTYTLNLQESGTSTYPVSWTGTEPNSFNTNQLPYTLPTASSSNRVTRTGYTFDGWYTASTGGTKVTSIPAEASSAADKTYYAQWTLNTYTITYNWNGGGSWVNDYTAPNEFTITSGAVTLPTADKVTRTNYIFTGWYDAATNGTKYTAVPANSYGNKTYYAQWASAVVSANSVDAALTAIQNAAEGQTVKITCSLSDDDISSINTKIKNRSSAIGLDLSQTGLVVLPDNAFANNFSLSSVILPDTLNSIGNYAFYRAGTALSYIEIPKNVTTIGTRAFEANFTRIDVDFDNETFESFGGLCYKAGKGGSSGSATGRTLICYVGDPSTNWIDTTGLERISISACTGRTNITSVKIASSVKHIDASAFNVNSNLQEVDIWCDSSNTEGLTIDRQVFSQCGNTNFTKITIRGIPSTSWDSYVHFSNNADANTASHWLYLTNVSELYFTEDNVTIPVTHP